MEPPNELRARLLIGLGIEVAIEKIFEIGRKRVDVFLVAAGSVLDDVPKGL